MQEQDKVRAVEALTQALGINPKNELARIELKSLERPVSDKERIEAVGRYLQRHATESGTNVV